MGWLIVFAILKILHFGRKVHIVGKYQARYASRLGFGWGAKDEKALFPQSALFRPIQSPLFLFLEPLTEL